VVVAIVILSNVIAVNTFSQIAIPIIARSVEVMIYIMRDCNDILGCIKMSFQEKEDEVKTWECEKYRHYVECLKCNEKMEEIKSVGWRAHIVVIKEHTLECPECKHQIEINR
jgi:hypothetical protein